MTVETHHCPECGGALPQDAFVCRACIHDTRKQLLSIALLMPHADAKRARMGTNWKDGTIGRAADTPLPFDPRVTETIQGFTNWLIGIARIIEDHTGETWPADAVALVLWVRERAAWTSRQAWATDVTTGTKAAHAQFYRVFDIPPETYAIGQCMAEHEDGSLCREYLAAPAREGIHRCPKCGQQHDVIKRRAELIAQSSDLHVTADEATRLLRLDGMDIDVRTVRAVIKQVPIREGGTRPVRDIKGRERQVSAYRLGEIQDAVRLLAEDRDMQREVNRIKRGSSAQREPAV